jgi:hypothetical protein
MPAARTRHCGSLPTLDSHGNRAEDGGLGAPGPRPGLHTPLARIGMVVEASLAVEVGNFPAQRSKHGAAAPTHCKRNVIDFATLTVQFSNAPMYVIACECIGHLQIVTPKAGAQRSRGRVA